MNSTSKVIRRALVVGAASLMLGASSTLAQIGTLPTGEKDKNRVVLEPPTLQLKSSDSGTWGMVVGVVLLLGILGVATIPAKRGHQD
jgi:hypothetical protein